MAEYPVENLSFLEAIESMIGGEASKDTSYVKRVNPRGRANLSTGLRGFLEELRGNPSMLDELLAEQTEARDAPAYEPTHTLGGRGLAEGNKARSSQERKSKGSDLVSQIEAIKEALGEAEPEAEAAAPEANEEPDFDYDDLVAKRAKKQDRKARKQGKRAAKQAPAEEQAPADTAKERMLGSIKEDPTGEEYDTAFDQELPEGMEDAVSSADIPVASEDQALALFDVVHGKGGFDPNSSMDRGKLAKIKENLVRDEFKGLSPNQFALKMYREDA
tara:strand:+ start:16 stop:840 length:825 start_codon:yes stop_codon:yes gene_type:complete